MVNDKQVRAIKVIKQWGNSRWKIAKQSEAGYLLLAGYLMAIVLMIEMYFVVPGISTGFGIIIDYIVITFIYILAITVARLIIVPLFKFFYLTKGMFLIVVSIALFLQTYIITKQIDWNTYISLLFSSILCVGALLISILISYLWFNSRKWTWISLLLLIVVLMTSIYVIKQEQLQQAAPVTEPEVLHDVLIQQQSEYHFEPATLTTNPAEKGTYTYKHIQYTSALEQTEAEQVLDENGELKSILFPSIDGSNLITDWSWSKEMYWGFSESDIPIWGELWVPEGEGPFPIIYIMHGNHISETDSSVGYNYLAELFASHGYIVSSIDANFLNFSVWSGIVDNDQLLRAWLFLAQINTFYNANILPVDWNNVALIGHSRGGQAAAMAVDIKNWITDDEQIGILDKVNINAVVGIAPTDYTVDQKIAYLEGVNYLTIHGTLDSDLTEFFGERQFERTKVNADTYKASVIIYGANHGQFNETWGKYDDQFPAALILNTEHLLDEQAQQLAAQVFINGFIQSVFEQKHEYKQLFQDSRVAQSYLPIAGYVTQYEDHQMNSYYSFDNEQHITNIQSSALLDYKIVELKGRNGTSKYNDVLQVNWEIGYSKLLFPITRQMKGYGTKPIVAYMFQIAKNEPSQKVDDIVNMNIEVDFITNDNVSRVDLKSAYQLLDPYIPTYLKLDFLEDDIKQGKYMPNKEPYLQTYILPISLIEHFAQSHSKWQSEDLTGIQFWFKDKSGSIMLDDIGVIYEGGNYVKYE